MEMQARWMAELAPANQRPGAAAETGNMRVKQALVLVGGKGTRLGTLTATTPKPLLPIAPGLCFLDVVIDEVARRGFTEIILMAGYLAEQFQERYDGRNRHGAQISVVCEPEPAGTGGALLCVADRLDSLFLMMNGDTLFDFNLRDLVSRPPQRALGRIALRRIDDTRRYGKVTLEDGLIKAFIEKESGSVGSGMISGGAYLLSRDILAGIAGPCSIERDVFPGLADASLLEGQVFEGYFLDMGLPETYSQAIDEIPARRIRPVAFLDRDGVLNADTQYTHRAEDLVWIGGAREAVRALNDAGYYVIVVTNQAGIGRGFYDEPSMHAFHDRMQNELAAIGAYIDAFYYCPFHPDAQLAKYRHPDHPDRKPNPGMLLRAFENWPVRIADSFLIGDRLSDIEAARRAGVRGFLFEGGDLAKFVSEILLKVAP
jgi:histidinol-phosphate phosphatase family protein